LRKIGRFGGRELPDPLLRRGWIGAQLVSLKLSRQFRRIRRYDRTERLVFGFLCHCHGFLSNICAVNGLKMRNALMQ